MKNYNQVHRLVFLLFFIIQMTFSFGQKQTDATAPNSIPELQKAIEKVLLETQTPAIGLALINSNGSTWTTSIGKSDIANDSKANDSTLFRIGSTSKIFVSLALLKLQEEGYLSLKDKVRDLIPEIEFKNPWQTTNPILIEHLLEHTTGWDDIHLTEYAHNVPRLSLKEGLDFHPQSRTSRWIPGTRHAYCNSSPAVAAYIVEKITGQTFEEYIQQHFFTPLGMKTATYFESKYYQQNAAQLYRNNQAQDYWHIIMRPSGAINASPKDMAQMVQFFINRGRVGPSNIIKEQSMMRMETATTSIGSKAGLEVGYGLTNYSSPHKQFIYRSHHGTVYGGLSDFSYIPEYNMGYALMINSDNYEARDQIAQLIRNFQTKDVIAAKNNHPPFDSNKVVDLSGYYTNINPSNQQLNCISRILRIKQLDFKNNQLLLKSLSDGTITTYIPINKNQFISTETNRISLVRTHDPIDGEVIQVNSSVLKPTSPLIVFGQLIIAGLWIIGSSISLLLGLIWVIRYWIGASIKSSLIKAYMGPILSSLILFITLLLIFGGLANAMESFGKMSWISVSITLSTICYAIVAIGSIFYLIKTNKPSFKKWAYLFSITLTSLHFIVTCYFMWHGIIGIQTWN